MHNNRVETEVAKDDLPTQLKLHDEPIDETLVTKCRTTLEGDLHDVFSVRDSQAASSLLVEGRLP